MNSLQNLKCTFYRESFKLSEYGFFISKLQKLTCLEQKMYSSIYVSICINMFLKNGIRLAAIRFNKTIFLQNLKCTFYREGFKLSESGFFISKLKKLTSQEQKPCTSMYVSMCINMYTVRKSFQGNQFSAKTEMVIVKRSLQAFRI